MSRRRLPRAIGAVAPIVFCCAAALGQEPEAKAPTVPPPPAPAPAPTPALQRAAKDAVTSCENLRTAPFAFKGAFQVTRMVDRKFVDAEPVPFTGAWMDDLFFFECGRHRVLEHAQRQMVSLKDGPWTEPQGDALDCPLPPLVLAKHFATASVADWQPCEYGGRPALRVHSIWTGEALKDCMGELHGTDKSTMRIVENIASRGGPADRLRLDVVLHFDPATKRVYGACIRFASIADARTAPTLPALDEPRPEANLPPLPAPFSFQMLWSVQIEGPDAPVSLPTLDEAMRKRLAWPKVAAAPAPKSRK